MKILFITSTRIGDAVLSTGLLQHLVANCPDVRITVACGPAPAPLFGAMPGLERILVLEKKRFAGHWLGLWKRCIPVFWDLIVDIRQSVAARLLLARAYRTLGRARSGEHQVRRLGAVLGLDPPPSPKLWIGAHEDAEAGRLIPADGPVLGLGPTANWMPKTWPADRFGALAARLTAEDGILPGGRIAVFGAAGERAVAQRVIDAIPPDRCIDLVGRSGLATVTACLARLSLYIGNDSGLMHMAAATGTPTLGLFGPSSPSVYAPWGDHTAWVATRIQYERLIGTPGFDYRDTSCLMESLSVDAAVTAATELWQRCRPATA